MSVGGSLYNSHRIEKAGATARPERAEARTAAIRLSVRGDAASNLNCEPLINAHTAASLLAISPKTFKRMATKGEVPAVRIGNRWYSRASELDAWMHSRLLSSGQPCPERSVRE